MNFTDPDSRIVRNSDKAFAPVYNLQRPDRGRQRSSDHRRRHADEPGCRHPHLIRLVNQTVEHIGAPAEISADAGYWSETNLDHLDALGIESVIPAEKIRPAERRGRIARGGWIPANATRRQRMARKRGAKRGRAGYTLRQTTVELPSTRPRKDEAYASSCFAVSRRFPDHGTSSAWYTASSRTSGAGGAVCTGKIAQGTPCLKASRSFKRERNFENQPRSG